MIKYFKKLGLIRLSELGAGLIVISLALLLVTGAKIFAVGEHINLAVVDRADVKEGMYVSMDVTEILQVYGEDTVRGGAYYVIPYPHTKETDDGIMTLMSVYIPEKYAAQAESIMLNTVSDALAKQSSIHLSGEIVSMSQSDNKLFNDCINECKKAYGLENVDVLQLQFRTVEMNVIDYIVTGFAIAIVVWFVFMIIYILSNKNQDLVYRFLREKNIDEKEFSDEIEKAKTFGKIIVSYKYVAFMMRYKVYVILKDDIEDVFQFERATGDADGPESIKEDILVIRLKNNMQYRIVMKNYNLEKILKYIRNEMIKA